MKIKTRIRLIKYVTIAIIFVASVSLIPFVLFGPLSGPQSVSEGVTVPLRTPPDNGYAYIKTNIPEGGIPDGAWLVLIQCPFMDDVTAILENQGYIVDERMVGETGKDCALFTEKGG